MPTAGKLFCYRETLSFEEIYAKLDGWLEVTATEEDTGGFELSRRIGGLDLHETTLGGLYSEDDVMSRRYRQELKVIPYTETGIFEFFIVNDTPYVVVMAPKRFANKIANRLSVAIHGETGAIVEPVLNMKAMRETYEASEALKIALFDNILLPNIDKTTLYGANVIQTDMYGRFVNEGQPWYVVFKDKSTAYTVGLVRDGSLVIFSSVDATEFMTYMKDTVVPLILRREAF